MKSRVPSPMLLLALLAAAAMLLQAGSVPHVHEDHDHEAGLFNQEHDLTLLAALAAHALEVDAVPAPVVAAVSAPVVPFVRAAPALRLTRAGESRAPPGA